MSQRFALISVIAVASALAIGGAKPSFRLVTVEYAVENGHTPVTRSGLPTRAGLSKEYVVGDVIEADGLPGTGGIGVVDGVNTTFALTYYPLGPAAVNLFVNGLYQSPGDDYTLNGKVLTLNNAPQSGDRVRVTYRAEFSQ